MRMTTGVQSLTLALSLTRLSTTPLLYVLWSFYLLLPVLTEPLQDERDDFDVIADYVFRVSWRWGCRSGCLLCSYVELRC